MPLPPTVSTGRRKPWTQPASRSTSGRKDSSIRKWSRFFWRCRTKFGKTCAKISTRSSTGSRIRLGPRAKNRSARVEIVEPSYSIKIFSCYGCIAHSGTGGSLPVRSAGIRSDRDQRHHLRTTNAHRPVLIRHARLRQRGAHALVLDAAGGGLGPLVQRPGGLGRLRPRPEKKSSGDVSRRCTLVSSRGTDVRRPAAAASPEIERAQCPARNVGFPAPAVVVALPLRVVCGVLAVRLAQRSRLQPQLRRAVRSRDPPVRGHSRTFLASEQWALEDLLRFILRRDRFQRNRVLRSEPRNREGSLFYGQLVRYSLFGVVCPVHGGGSRRIRALPLTGCRGRAGLRFLDGEPGHVGGAFATGHCALRHDRSQLASRRLALPRSGHVSDDVLDGLPVVHPAPPAEPRVAGHQPCIARGFASPPAYRVAQSPVLYGNH